MQTAVFHYYNLYTRLLLNTQLRPYLEKGFNINITPKETKLLINLAVLRDLHSFLLNQDYWKQNKTKMEITRFTHVIKILGECHWHSYVIKAGSFKSDNPKFNPEAAINRIGQEIINLTEAWETQYCSLIMLEFTLSSFSN